MLLKLIKSKKGAYNKLISMLLRFIAGKGRAFSPDFRLLNVDNIYCWKIIRRFFLFSRSDRCAYTSTSLASPLPIAPIDFLPTPSRLSLSPCPGSANPASHESRHQNIDNCFIPTPNVKISKLK